MYKAVLLRARSLPVSPAVAEAYAAAKAAYAAGHLGPLQGKLEMNFLMDRSAANWAAEFAKLKEEVGECQADEPLAPMGAMSTAFRLHWEQGRIDGRLMLAPKRPAPWQAARDREA